MLRGMRKYQKKVQRKVKLNNEIGKWLSFQPEPKPYTFSFVRVTENIKPDETITRLIQEKLLFSYNTDSYYLHYFNETATEDDIRKFVIEQVIPTENNQFDRNVRQGDWGEILASLIVKYFQKLEIPINKLQWKMNKNKSVFATDLIAFNNSEKIEDIYYYEIKTRQNPNKKEGKLKQFISVLAYKSLQKDAESPTESIINFLYKLYIEKEDFETANKFRDIMKNPQNYNKKYELFLIVETTKFNEQMLRDLNGLPPTLSPLNVTVVLIDNLKQLVKNTWQDIENVLVDRYMTNEAVQL